MNKDLKEQLKKERNRLIGIFRSGEEALLTLTKEHNSVRDKIYSINSLLDIEYEDFSEVKSNGR